MASTKSPRKKCSARYERGSKYQNLFYSEILHNQQKDSTSTGELADTLLICKGGTIPVHAFILQAASPLIQSAIASQGEDYPFVREILIPDFTVKEIENMMTLVYKGCVDLRNNQEVRSLQETLKFFQVSNVDFSPNKNDTIKGFVKVMGMRQIPQDIFKPQSKTENDHGSDDRDGASRKPEVIIFDPADEKRQEIDFVTEMPSPPCDEQPLRRSARAPKPIIVKLVKEGDIKGKSTDVDYKADSPDESSDEEFNEVEGSARRKRRRPPTNYLPVVKLPVLKWPRMDIPNPKPNGPMMTPTSTTVTTNGITVAGENPSANTDKQEDSGTDTEDEDWVEPNFKDKRWFARESRRCQSCNKSHERAADASLCVTSHRSLRCYFCFRIYSTTDILFKHFRRRHKQAGRESTLICPYCEQAVPYKSVSCHVISVHLKSRPEDDIKPRPTPTPASSTAHRSRSVSVETELVSRRSSTEDRYVPRKLQTLDSSSDSKAKKQCKQPRLKKVKKRNPVDSRVLKVPDLNVTLEKVSCFGRTITYKLKKKRLEEL